jgi:hypothetical protein
MLTTQPYPIPRSRMRGVLFPLPNTPATRSQEQFYPFLISNFRRILNVVCFLLGNSLPYEFYMPMFRNTLFHLHRWVGTYLPRTYPPMKKEQTECSETLAYKIQTPGNYPEESIQQLYLYFFFYLLPSITSSSVTRYPKLYTGIIQGYS